MSAGPVPRLTTPEGLRRFLERPRKPPGEHCEMCGEPISEAHSHVVNVESRNLLCSCRACYLLFTHEGAAQGKFRAVPDRYLYDPAFTLDTAQWDDLQIPVRMAFFFHNSSLERDVAFYPSPAGATESLLPLETWQGVMASNPHVADLLPDVEALLLNRNDKQTECYLVPIDACYELVGLVKLHWRGFGGGEEVWREIEDFFAGLRDKSRVVGAGSAG
ncbi:MAG: DUF5947 family protein [Thermomicrobiales bacterium]